MATGAVGGAIVGGPVGAVVGGAIGAVVGSALTPEQQPRVQQYVIQQRRPHTSISSRCRSERFSRPAGFSITSYLPTTA